MKIRDRIKELRRVRAAELAPNPKNWRTHPKAQQDALKGILAEVGYADALLARETPEGGLVLIDGHLRAETTPDTMVPVLVLDVDESEADKLLATLDPLAALADADAGKLNELLAGIETGSEALRHVLSRVADDAGAVAADETRPPADPNLETRYAVIVNCDSEQQQLALLEEFETRGIECRALVV
ncbi:MAG: ParB N-terminal domain-containing protein [Deltaproteobacteria bacterium]